MTDSEKVAITGDSKEPYGTMSRPVSTRSAPPNCTLSDSKSEDFNRMMQPGGLRRQYLNSQADEAGIPEDKRPQAWRESFVPQQIRALIRTGYVESSLEIGHDHFQDGEAGNWNAFLSLLKCYIGSSILFLPKGFEEGGWLVCPIILVLIGLLNMACISLLLECRKRPGCSGLGDMAQQSMGNWGKQMVLLSLVTSQMGAFVADMIFIAHMGASLGIASRKAIVLLELVIMLPLCLIKRLDELEISTLISDSLIIIAIVLCASRFIHHNATSGHSGSVKMFHHQTWGMFIGTAIFSFEGNPLVLSVHNSMREPENFWRLLCIVMPIVVVVFGVFGSLGYAAYGDESRSAVLVNLPDDAFSWVMKAMYIFALACGSPLHFVGVAQVTENWIVGETSKVRQSGWFSTVNTIRIAELGVFVIIALFFVERFEQFITFAGAILAGPLMVIYPPLFHYLLCANGPGAKVYDLVLIGIGIGCTVICLVGLADEFQES
eukprot:gnl/TRDRNA2_/TRDRNA2_182129_c0_seq1.p1 gnl/TRDRNA2_/TRDRNA2_182129_c0~~gnl/TRDRNA2_/TRDRNA2_182129_c0_seq1.p1  ORF type:complete len:491 (-),score=77.03 gnl/TRDRNA2_/TRDRNA2_182129_c0_seq1:69-1541(-)